MEYSFCRMHAYTLGKYRKMSLILKKKEKKIVTYVCLHLNETWNKKIFLYCLHITENKICNKFYAGFFIKLPIFGSGFVFSHLMRMWLRFWECSLHKSNILYLWEAIFKRNKSQTQMIRKKIFFLHSTVWKII